MPDVLQRIDQTSSVHVSIRRLGLALSCTMLSFAAEVPQALGDSHPTHPGVVVSENPPTYTPNVLNGHVDAFAQMGDTMVVGGDFTSVEQGGHTFARHNLFSFDVDTGAVLTAFHPRVHGEVLDLQAAPDGRSVYAVGDFTRVNRHSHTAHVARISVRGGRVISAFRPPVINGIVRDIAAANGVYYLAGGFTEVAGRKQTAIVALQADGRESDLVHLHFSGRNNGGTLGIRSMDVNPAGTMLAVAGNFSRVNGKRRPQLALIGASPSRTWVRPWSTGRYAPICGRHFNTYMRDVAFGSNGNFLIVVTTGGPKGGQQSGLLCDSAARWTVQPGSNQQPDWVDYTGGDTLTAAVVDANVIYVGGHQRWFNNGFGHNSMGPGAAPRQGIAALDPANGLPYTWNPGRPRGYGVYGFALTSGGLWVGHDTHAFSGEPLQRIAFCRADGAGIIALPQYLTGSLPGQLVLLGTSPNSTSTTYAFDGQRTSNAQLVNGAPNAEWTSARGTFVVDGTLYAGHLDGTLTAQPVDEDPQLSGIQLGQQRVVPLNGAFGNLSSVHAMFFDRVSRRLYFTLDGSRRLRYRYFQPQSEIVGSAQFAAPRSSPIPWKRIDGAFIANGKLYYVNSRAATLSAVSWHSSKGQTGSSDLCVGVGSSVGSGSVGGEEDS